MAVPEPESGRAEALRSPGRWRQPRLRPPCPAAAGPRGAAAEGPAGGAAAGASAERCPVTPPSAEASTGTMPTPQDCVTWSEGPYGEADWLEPPGRARAAAAAAGGNPAGSRAPSGGSSEGFQDARSELTERTPRARPPSGWARGGRRPAEAAAELQAPTAELRPPDGLEGALLRWWEVSPAVASGAAASRRRADRALSCAALAVLGARHACLASSTLGAWRRMAVASRATRSAQRRALAMVSRAAVAVLGARHACLAASTLGAWRRLTAARSASRRAQRSALAMVSRRHQDGDRAALRAACAAWRRWARTERSAARGRGEARRLVDGQPPMGGPPWSARSRPGLQADAGGASFAAAAGLRGAALSSLAGSALPVPAGPSSRGSSPPRGARSLEAGGRGGGGCPSERRLGSSGSSAFHSCAGDSSATPRSPAGAPARRVEAAADEAAWVCAAALVEEADAAEPSGRSGAAASAEPRAGRARGVPTAGPSGGAPAAEAVPPLVGQAPAAAGRAGGVPREGLGAPTVGAPVLDEPTEGPAGAVPPAAADLLSRAARRIAGLRQELRARDRAEALGGARPEAQRCRPGRASAFVDEVGPRQLRATAAVILEASRRIDEMQIELDSLRAASACEEGRGAADVAGPAGAPEVHAVPPTPLAWARVDDGRTAARPVTEIAAAASLALGDQDP
ncbi:unnamed protein product [Prorocentrum cordatum]|uniref:Uncharacterized protein n=1 Tax=Prorocentrum cordatum TaxID=2364126 RepID=A0ABN9XCV6_9DINO|nr:unnamed protein product [Polarella glacialis]